ncbi:MAG: hypothetical protein K0U98_11160 [Deltaproteobacteria bacterium]|nr:hypothetical protein [Deltaproteobacteria bacterium]
MRRILMIAALLVTGAAAQLGFSPEAQALPGQEVETVWYTDDTLTTEVGWSIRVCGGGYAFWGVKTGYRVTYKGESCSPQGNSGSTPCKICAQVTVSPPNPPRFTRVRCSLDATYRQDIPVCPGEPFS